MGTSSILLLLITMLLSVCFVLDGQMKRVLVLWSECDVVASLCCNSCNSVRLLFALCGVM